jgi:hypothetical protein
MSKYSLHGPAIPSPVVPVGAPLPKSRMTDVGTAPISGTAGGGGVFVRLSTPARVSICHREGTACPPIVRLELAAIAIRLAPCSPGVGVSGNR